MINLVPLAILPFLNFTSPSLSSDYVAQVKQIFNQEIGLEEIGTGAFNQLSIPLYQYTGECPGRQKGYVEATFTSSEIPPKRGRRVIVRNISSGIADIPYTDRDYSGERNSEPTDITIGPGPDPKYLIVRNGLNTFEYQVKQGNSVLKRGQFQANVKWETIIEERYKEPQEKTVCPNDRAYCDSEEMIRVTVYECPSSTGVRRGDIW